MIDFYVIEHYALKNGLSIENSTKLHNELEIFLKNASLENHLVPSKKIDDVWHNFILHTKKYSKYCFENFNKFIHHNPYMPNFIKEISCDTEDCDASIENLLKADCDGGSCDSQVSN